MFLERISDYHPQTRDRCGWTCLHYALSLLNPSPAAASWISATLALPGVAVLQKTALSELASNPTVMYKSQEAVLLELFRGDEEAAKVLETAVLNVRLCHHQQAM